MQLTIDKAISVKATGEDDAGNRGNLSTVVGIVVASSAITGIAAGPISPAVAFVYFVVLLGGLFVAIAGVRAPLGLGWLDGCRQRIIGWRQLLH